MPWGECLFVVAPKIFLVKLTIIDWHSLLNFRLAALGWFSTYNSQQALSCSCSLLDILMHTSPCIAFRHVKINRKSNILVYWLGIYLRCLNLKIKKQPSLLGRGDCFAVPPNLLLDLYNGFMPAQPT